MKFTFSVGGTTILATAEQLDAMTRILEHCDALHDHNVGKDLGTHGYNMSYIHHIRPYNISESLTVKVMTTEQYEATKLVTKLSKEEK
jgi:hypothetical protein